MIRIRWIILLKNDNPGNNMAVAQVGRFKGVKEWALFFKSDI